MYDEISEEYINQRIGEQQLSADEWASLTKHVIDSLHSWRLYKSQDRLTRVDIADVSICDN